MKASPSPAPICLSEDAYRQVKGRLDLSVSDLGATELKNIAEPIRVYSLEVGGGAQAGAAAPAAAAAPEKPAPPRLSIVVLPFASLGGGPEQDQFVDGVTESLTTDLARIANSFIVARNTAFTYKGKPVDAKQVGRELNVRYILEGSIQRGGSRMRVNVQLIDALTGNHMWADRFDKPMADLFDMQDEIVSQLANQLRPELLAAEARRAEGEENPDSVDLYLLGNQWFNKGGTASVERAREYFERAVALDPTNVDALVGAARADVLLGGGVFADAERDEQRLAAAERLLIKGISIAPRNYWAHLWLGFIQILTNRASRGIGELERALTLNRNLGAAHAWIGLAKIAMGRAEETEAHINEAFRIAPSEGVGFIWMHMAALANFHLGKDEEALAGFRRSIGASRNYPLIISMAQRRSPTSAGSTRRGRRLRPVSHSRRSSRSRTFVVWATATIRPISRNGRAWRRACAWRECRRTHRLGGRMSGGRSLGWRGPWNVGRRQPLW